MNHQLKRNQKVLSTLCVLLSQGRFFGVPPKIYIPIATFSVVAVVLAVVLTLPETITCDPKKEDYYTRVVPLPVIDHVTPSLVCSHYGEVDVQVTGSGFLTYNGNKFRVLLDDQELSVKNLGNCKPLRINLTFRNQNNILTDERNLFIFFC